MKKLALAATLMMLCGAPLLAHSATEAAKGGFDGPATTQTQPATEGGFSGPSATNTTVDKVKSMRDDARVTLQGNIVERLGHDTYTFRDSTGTITVDIDSKRWKGQTITPQDKVQIEGKVDKDWNSVEVDVKNITKIQ
ncbi:YgiW/YdeI family stress tolerance OB fold protein [Yersinia mollaretii]|uniref:YgiW/YdeI family stress tolerance OB fold protein n=1 Tax=Yersinia mollaretii TaxID=33060 RepID=UPI0005E0C445|nr:YgiW/YdeI family stress tolerance OB fold protein [Yersinia mollaretii]MDA5527179.1 YgiW/YdeI family stress tolerance OB fold protein [Yersinia mollaretii]MDA5533517.1 YgiW/YdeI family stress tolerance OB fold protein [Yersinia mollaretii]MDR7874581.1 YgiW/YdeI family stress tolerance OB fold protein [Yersinia mollaretii]NIL01449.1 YgiW/YdeI family stress tolerance OB fold protein [Yersinia mollaretii]PHZ30699.1 TIGR00156 family protein [Yersinia mollaretii]